jgi:hypothetical protein
VHGNVVYRLTDFIKLEPSKSRWRAQIHPVKGYVCFLISAVKGRMDGGDPIGCWGRWCWDTGTTTAIAAPHKLARAPPRAPRMLRLEFFDLKRCGDIGDTHPGFNVVGDDFKVADGGSLNFPSSDDVARPHSRSSGPKDGFPSFLILSSRSSPGPIASGGGGLAYAAIA